MAQTKLFIIPQEAADQICNSRLELDYTTMIDAIAEHESRTQHDLAAFLAWWRCFLPPLGSRWLHYGLTSSDVIETANSLMMRDSQVEVESIGKSLVYTLSELSDQNSNTFFLGRTHGQPAEPTSLKIKVKEWENLIKRTLLQLEYASQELTLCKLSGPIGTYAHNSPAVERRVAASLELLPAGSGCSQVIPRDRLSHWAQCAAALVGACAKITTDFRLLASFGEVSEGWPSDRVGSTSMPHKRNPVNAEKVCGMARLAYSYADMLRPVDLWGERDISHSSVERVAVPDLFHAVIHALETTNDILINADWHTDVMIKNLEAAGDTIYSAARVFRMINQSETVTRAEAEKNALIGGIKPDFKWYTRNFPI